MTNALDRSVERMVRQLGPARRRELFSSLLAEWGCTPEIQAEDTRIRGLVSVIESKGGFYRLSEAQAKARLHGHPCFLTVTEMDHPKYPR